MYSVRKIKVARWTERFIDSSANPSSLYTGKVTTPCHTLSQLQWSVRSGSMIQSLPFPDIDFIGSDLKPYSCHLTYRLTEAIPGHSHIYDLMGAESSDWLRACVHYTRESTRPSAACWYLWVSAAPCWANTLFTALQMQSAQLEQYYHICTVLVGVLISLK